MQAKLDDLFAAVKNVKPIDADCTNGACGAKVGQMCVYGFGPAVRSEAHPGRFEKARNEALDRLKEFVEEDYGDWRYESGIDAGTPCC
jgi:hypothetical protein